MEAILCFDHWSESNPDKIFDKNTIFSAFFLNIAFFIIIIKLTHIQVLIRMH